jgi:Alcohol dehydrogenase transcription factor Myb/SANT-like.
MSRQEDDKLIKAVAAHPAVFDMKHVLYKDQHTKDSIWVVITGEVTTMQRAHRKENFKL